MDRMNRKASLDRKAIYLEHMQNEAGALNEAQPKPADYEAEFKTIDEVVAAINKFLRTKGYEVHGTPLLYRRSDWQGRGQSTKIGRAHV